MSFGDPNNPYDNAHGQQPPYGQQPGYPQQAPQGVPPQYGHPQYDHPQYGHPQQVPPPYGYPQQQPLPGGPYGAYPPPGMPELAHWGLRLGAYLLDMLIIAGPMYGLGFVDLITAPDPATAKPGVFFLVGVLYAVAMSVFQIFQEGRRGQTLGKRAVGISLLREADGRTLGFGMAFVRKLAHFLDSLACYLGWLWPLWDEKRQTFADKVCGTVVIRTPRR
ncbi:RDD family protein [Streptomyces sp. NPDC059708]|uniref:RDD family protein n=1 Tax=Streptomyces sp. NPDC059708 TaxID=3346916 RepID=UPI0036864B1C